MAVNIWLAVSSTVSVELKADPSVILASVAEVNKAKDEAKDYTDRGRRRTKVFSGLSLPPSPTQSVTFGKMTTRSARSDFTARMSILMTCIRGHNGCTPAKTKRSASERLTVRTSGRVAAAIMSLSSRLTCQLCRLMSVAKPANSPSKR